MGQMLELTAADGFALSAYRADPPGKPRGGEAQGLRAYFEFLRRRYVATA